MVRIFRAIFYIFAPRVMPSIEEQKLYEQIYLGDEKAFDVFFLKHYSLLCAYANSYVGFEVGEEIVQDVMVWFWENRTKHVIQKSLKSYLFTAVRNRCFTQLNRDKLKKHIISSLQNSLEGSSENPDFYIVEELTRKIGEALSRLPETYREAFKMNRFQGLTYSDIAEKLAVSPKTVDYRIQQSLKILRVELKDYLPLLAALNLTQI